MSEGRTRKPTEQDRRLARERAQRRQASEQESDRGATDAGAVGDEHSVDRGRHAADRGNGRPGQDRDGRSAP